MNNLKIQDRCLESAQQLLPDRKEQICAACSRDIAQIDDLLPAKCTQECGYVARADHHRVAKVRQLADNRATDNAAAEDADFRGFSGGFALSVALMQPLWYDTDLYRLFYYTIQICIVSRAKLG